MYLPGHLGLALLVFAPFAYRFSRTGRGRRVGVGTLTVLLLATLPDVDGYVPGVVHRGITHTVWAALVVGALLALLGWRLHAGPARSRAARFAFLLGALSVLSHLLGDVLTPMGIRPFAPLVGSEYTLALVAARNPDANLAFLVAGVLALAPSVGHVWVRAERPLPVESVRSLVERSGVAAAGRERVDPAVED